MLFVAEKDWSHAWSDRGFVHVQILLLNEEEQHLHVCEITVTLQVLQCTVCSDRTDAKFVLCKCAVWNLGCELVTFRDSAVQGVVLTPRVIVPEKRAGPCMLVK